MLAFQDPHDFVNNPNECLSRPLLKLALASSRIAPTGDVNTDQIQKATTSNAPTNRDPNHADEINKVLRETWTHSNASHYLRGEF